MKVLSIINKIFGNKKYYPRGMNSLVDTSVPDFVEIGKNFVSAPGSIVLAHDASTITHCDKLRVEKTIIKDNVFLGANAVILPGITVGNNSNGSEGQQHLGIIESISKYNFENVFFIFPVTYGISDHYLSQISAALKNLKMPSVLLTEFMTSKQIASLRLLSSFFIQLQITDTLSGAMLEHLYAGSVVITGSWLKYDVLDKMGMYLQKVDHVSEIGDKLHSLISVFDSEKNLTNKNQKAVWELASWEYCLKNWKEL